MKKHAGFHAHLVHELRVLLDNIHAIDQHSAGSRLVKADNMFEQSGFTAAAAA